MADLDVLVVGAGPTGLTLGIQLARSGARFRLIDRKMGPSMQSKATQINPRTLEILEDFDLIDEALEIGQHVHGLAIYSEDRRIVHGSYDEFDAPYPFLLNLGQVHTERLLSKRLADAPIEWQVELTGFTQEESHVKASLRHEDGREESVTCRYLVGCDGAHSLTRKTLNMGLIGKTYPFDTMLGDCILEWDLPRDEILICLMETSTMVISPIPEGRYQIATDYPLLEGKSRKEAGITPTLEELQAAFHTRCPIPGTLRDPIWLTYYATHSRHVGHLREGRVFLAGDAAHVTSPLTGLGLNQGVQDAYNLGWKMGLVLSGKGRDELLDSYSPERMASLPDLKRFADQQTAILRPRHPIGNKIRDKLLEIGSGIDLFWRRAYRDTSQLDWGYRQSPIVSEYAGIPTHLPSAQHLVDHGSCIKAWSYFGSGPHAGDRAPDSDRLTIPAGERQRLYPHLIDGKHHLLLFAGCQQPEPAVCENLALIANSIDSQYGDLVSVHLLIPSDFNRSGISWSQSVLLDHRFDCHHRYGAYGECLYLIRPDGHVGFRSQPPLLDRLEEYLASIFLRTSERL